MNTITLDNTTYNAVVDYAKRNNVTITDVVRAGVDLLKAQFGRKSTTDGKYYISPEVKALETGFKCPEDISWDYKKEVIEGLSEKYL